jgi:hypothetical protein
MSYDDLFSSVRRLRLGPASHLLLTWRCAARALTNGSAQERIINSQ